MKSKQKLISILLSLIMALGSFPMAMITANAVDYYDLWVGKWRADSVAKDDIMHDGGSAKYDPATHTLTLNNPTITLGTGGCMILAKGDLKIVGTISYTKSGDYGVKVTGGSLTFGDAAGDPSSMKFIGSNAAVYAEGDIIIENCSFSAESASGSGIESKTGSVKIDCKDKDVIAVGAVYGVKAETEADVLGGKVRAAASADDSIGMYAKNGEVYIDGEVSATGEKAGIWSLSSFAAVNNAVVTAVCTREREKNTTDYGYGIYCGDNFGANGTVDARGGHTAIYAKKNCTITGGSVSADKAWYGFGIAGDYSQNNADVRGRGQINGFGVAGKCDIDGGTLFAEGPSDAAFHVNGAVTIDSALVINLPEGGTLDGSKIKNAEGYEAKTVQIGKPIEKYKVWVGSLQLTELNKDDAYGDGTVVYDASTHTLTLNDPTVLGAYKDSKIYIDGIDVAIQGKATLEGAEFGINSDSGSIELGGEFTLKGKHSGISSGGNLTVKEGTVVAEGEDYEGIYTFYDCVIDGDDVTATGGTCGIYSEDGNLTIGGGIVTASGTEERAVYVNAGSFVIDHGATLNTDGNEHGIFALNGIALKDSHVDAKSKTDAAICSADGSVVVEACTLNAESEQGAAVDCADGDFVFNGTAVLKGKTDGVKARRVTVTDGRLEAYGADGAAINVGDSGMTMAAGEVIAEGANGILIADSDFYLGGGELSATATSEDAESYALCAANGKLSAINGTVKAKSNGSAVFANGKISLDMTNLSADAQKGYALGSNSDAVFNGGTSALTSAENDAIHTKGNLLFDNAATVTAKGGKYGICAEKELYFNKANIDAEGATDAVMSEEGNLTIESSLYLTEPMHGKIDSEKKTVVTLHEEKAPSVKIRTDNMSFNVFVGSTEITMDNMDDVQGDAKISFDPVDNTLHFIDNVAIIGDHNGAKIYAKDVDLKIDGNEDILDDTVAYGVLVEGGSVTFDGFFKIKGGDAAVKSEKDITVLNGGVEAEGGSKGLFAGGNITIKDSSVDAKGNDAICADVEVYISNGGVTADGVNGAGIFAMNGNITITDVTLVTAKGTNAGIRTVNGNIEIGKSCNVSADGGENNAVFFASTFTLDDTVYISEPAGAKIDSGTVMNEDGTTFAAKVKIEPKPPVHVVSFDAKGGTEVEAQEVFEGANAMKPADPTRTGFSFEGWYADEAYTTAYAFTETVNADITVYAKWKEETPPEPLKFNVTFSVDGGSEVAPQVVEEGNKAAKPEDPTKEGYDFVGWYTDDTFSAGFDFDAVITGDTTIYAKWSKHEEATPNKYSVVFHVDGGSEIASQIVEEGGLVARPEDPTREGFVFKGWFTDDTFAAAFDFTAPVTADVTVYAKWVANDAPEAAKYTVTFISNGGSAVEAQTVEEGDLAVKPADPSKEGYIFKGWFTDEELTAEYNFLAAVTADVTLYVKWEKAETPEDPEHPTDPGETTEPVDPGETTEPVDPTGPSEIDFMIGDVNGDGKVNSQDARLALRAAARLQTLDERAFKAADVVADGKVKSADARKILRVAAKLETF